jgi:hypothetical protein
MQIADEDAQRTGYRFLSGYITLKTEKCLLNAMSIITPSTSRNNELVAEASHLVQNYNK